MRAHIFVYIIEEVVCAHAQNAPLSRVVLVSTWARSRAKAVEQDLLVAYLVVDIFCKNSCQQQEYIYQPRPYPYTTQHKQLLPAGMDIWTFALLLYCINTPLHCIYSALFWPPLPLLIFPLPCHTLCRSKLKYTLT